MVVGRYSGRFSINNVQKPSERHRLHVERRRRKSGHAVARTKESVPIFAVRLLGHATYLEHGK